MRFLFFGRSTAQRTKVDEQGTTSLHASYMQLCIVLRTCLVSDTGPDVKVLLFSDYKREEAGCSLGANPMLGLNWDLVDSSATLT